MTPTVISRTRRAAAAVDFGVIWRNPTAFGGGLLVGSVVFLALLGEFVAPYSAQEMRTDASFASPSWTNAMGTDQFGRDVFSRVITGARTSLVISAAAVMGALLMGGTLALVVGYAGGVLDLIVTRIIDILISIPTLLMAIGIVALLGRSGFAVAVALAFAYSPTFARVIRSAVVSTRHQPYVEASIGLGARPSTVVLRDVLPNVLPVITVQATSALAWGILDEANLGFLGLGVQPPDHSWGAMLIEGRIYLFQAPWITVAAGIAVLAAVFGFNLLGDGLRDRWDPRAWRKD